MRSALEGVRVLELASGWSAAALAGRLLADLGAQVVMLESRAGDPARSGWPRAPDGQGLAFHLVAAGKRSVRLTGAIASDRVLVACLAGASDVLLTDDRGLGRLVDLGFDGVERSQAPWPHLVVCSITPFGLRGPLAGWRAGELTLQAMSGVMATTGYPERGPTRAGVPLGAHVAALLSAVAILAALRVREAGGPGQWIDMAVHDALVACLGTFLPTWFLDGKAPERQGNRHIMNAPWNTFRCADGWAVVCAGTDRLWLALLRAIGRQDLEADPRYATIDARFARNGEVEALVGAWMEARTVRDAIERLDTAGVPAAPVSDVADLLADPHFRARGMVQTVPGATGTPVPTIGPLAKLGLTPGRVERGAPPLGEATEELSRRAASEARPEAPSAGDLGTPPLHGVRVVEMGTFTAGPAGVRLLGALGAEVVKIEPPGGEACRHLAQKLGGDAYLFHLNNTDKRSVVLDPASPADRQALAALILASDVFIESFAPGTAEGWGLGPATLLARNPRLVYASVSGFGHAGPARARRAFDTVIQAAAGVMALTGFPDDPPVKLGLSISDLLGAFFAAIGVLAALRVRDRTGRGQHVDVSMHDVSGWLTAAAWPALLVGALDGDGAPGDHRAGAPAARHGNRHPDEVPSNVYVARDGVDVVIEVRDDDEWRRLARVIGDESLAVDPGYATAAGRQARAAEVEARVAAWVAARPGAGAVAAMQAGGVPSGPVLGVPEVAEHPHTLARELIVTRTHPVVGPIRLLGVPLKLSRSPVTVRRAAPVLGADTADVLRVSPHR